jgi:DinB superfamily
MTYSNLDEIYHTVDETRARLVAAVENLDAAQTAFRPAPDAWNVAQIVEHLHLAEVGMNRIISLLLAKKTAGGSGFQPFSLVETVAPFAGQKFKAPDSVAPTGQVAVRDSLIKLAQSRAALHALRPQLAEPAAAGATFPHPVFGPFDCYQWLAFVGGHEARHAAQIKGILVAMA